MARIERLYDEFTCPHAGEPWHAQASDLQQKLVETTHKCVREFYQLAPEK